MCYNVSMDTKLCSKCGVEKILDNFYRKKWGLKGTSPMCKPCYCAYERAIRARDIEGTRAKQRKFRTNWVKRHPARMRYTTLRNGHRRELLFTRDEFERWIDGQSRTCYYCHCDVYWYAASGRQMKERDALTIDRKDNEKPYTLDNIAIACWRCNKVKGEFVSESKMLEVALLLE